MSFSFFLSWNILISGLNYSRVSWDMACSNWRKEKNKLFWQLPWKRMRGLPWTMSCRWMETVIALADLPSVALERCMIGAASFLWSTRAENKHFSLSCLQESSGSLEISRLLLSITVKAKMTACWYFPSRPSVAIIITHHQGLLVTCTSFSLFGWTGTWTGKGLASDAGLIQLQVGKFAQNHESIKCIIESFICFY